MKDERVLVLGSGNSDTVRVQVGQTVVDPAATFHNTFKEVVTVDYSAAAKPDVVWDLRQFPWPFKDEEFDQVHAYEVLEHLTRAGDVEAFFALWREIWRVLKPGGMVCATAPKWDGPWAWCDPGHGIVYSKVMLSYLNQIQYEMQVGHGAMSDYRDPHWPIQYNLNMVYPSKETDQSKSASFIFVLQKLRLEESRCLYKPE